MSSLIPDGHMLLRRAVVLLDSDRDFTGVRAFVLVVLPEQRLGLDSLAQLQPVVDILGCSSEYAECETRCQAAKETPFFVQIGERGEYAAADHVALDPAEPQLHLVKPGGIGRGEVQVHVGMLGEEGLDLLGLVGREIVRDHMGLLAARLVEHDVGEKGHELGRGVRRSGLAQQLAGLGIEGSVHGERAVAVVLKAVPLEAPRRQRQHRIFTIKCLNMRLFIHAEGRRVRGWVQVQPDDICRLLLEVRIVRGHVALETAGLKSVLAPHLSDHHVIDAKMLSEATRAPALCRPSDRCVSLPESVPQGAASAPWSPVRCAGCKGPPDAALRTASSSWPQTLGCTALARTLHPRYGPRTTAGSADFGASRSARRPPLQFHTFHVRQVNGVAHERQYISLQMNVTGMALV